MIIQHDKNTEKLNLIEKFRQAFINREFVSFILCGGINGLSCIGSSMLLSKMLGANLAFVLGYIISLFVSYFLNGYITFKRRVNISGFFWFAFSYIPNFIIQNIMVFVIYNILGVHVLIAYICAGILGVPVTFLLVRALAFKVK